MADTSGVIALIAKIRGLSHGFERVYSDHVEHNAQLLEYVLFDEWSRFVIDDFQTGHDDSLVAWVTVLDEAMSRGDDATTVLIRTTFLESVDSLWEDARHRELVARLTPQLRAGLAVGDA
jgi:hypothetical protein